MEAKSRLGEYELGKKLGSGQYSKVREGLKANDKYAVKYMKKELNPHLSKTCLDLINNEVKVMSVLDHPNLVKLFEYNEKGVIEKAKGKNVPVLYLVLELITGGELFDYIAVSGRFSDKLARYYFKQFIEALEYMHSKGFVHRDIKTENILLDSNYKLKLADFGFSAPMEGRDGSGVLKTAKGTEGYMAPEILAGLPYSGEKADLFAAGVLLFIMIAQHPPFRKASPRDGFYKLFCQHNDLFWNKMASGKPANTFTPELKELLTELMASDPEKRPSIPDIKNSKWFTSDASTEEEVNAEFAVRKAKVEEDWKIKAQEALKKKKMKGGGFGFVAYAAIRGVMHEETTVASAVKKVLPIYEVIFHLNIASWT
jgi:serine/threonine protein kinase